MNSCCSLHFPRVAYEGGQRWLWNPITKKRLANRPEERVRLRMIDYLTLEAQIPAGRISQELTLLSNELGDKDRGMRADIVVYGGDMEPETLIECKSATVSLSKDSAVQISRYNEHVGARHLWLSNGHSDAIFTFENGELKRRRKPIYPSAMSVEDLRRETSYWVERGFIGRALDPNAQQWLTQVLQEFWDPSHEWAYGYVDLARSDMGVHASHYYQSIPLDDETDVALAFVSPNPEETLLVAILNQSQQTVAVFVTDLQDLWTAQPENTTIYTTQSQERASLLKHVPLKTDEINPMVISNLAGFYESWFRQLYLL